MRKKFMNLFALVGLVALFAACSSDNDDDNKKPSIVDPALVGQWNTTKESLLLNWTPADGVEPEDFTIHVPTIPEVMEEQDIQIAFLTMMAGPMGSPMLQGVLKSVSFLENSDITAEYKEDEVWKTSPKGLISYNVITINELMSVKLNASNIIKEAGITDPEVIKALTAAFKESISLKYKVEGDNLTCFIDKDLLNSFLPRIQSILSGLTLDESMLAMINGMLKQLPGIMEKTDVFEVGLKFSNK